MTKVELKAALDQAGVDPNAYSLFGELKDGCITFSQQPNGRWSVFYSYKGTHVNRRSFDSESAACEDLLDRMLHTLAIRRKYGKMNRNDLKAELELEGVEPRWYVLDGSKFPGDQDALSREPDGRWVVYFSERGTRLSLVSFDSESDACEHMLDRVLSSRQLEDDRSRQAREKKEKREKNGENAATDGT